MQLPPDAEFALLQSLLGNLIATLGAECEIASPARRHEIELLLAIRPDYRRWCELACATGAVHEHGPVFQATADRVAKVMTDQKNW